MATSRPDLSQHGVSNGELNNTGQPSNLHGAKLCRIYLSGSIPGQGF